MVMGRLIGACVVAAGAEGILLGALSGGACEECPWLKKHFGSLSGSARAVAIRPLGQGVLYETQGIIA